MISNIPLLTSVPVVLLQFVVGGIFLLSTNRVKLSCLLYIINISAYTIFSMYNFFYPKKIYLNHIIVCYMSSLIRARQCESFYQQRFRF
jgi:hypothetical protein